MSQFPSPYYQPPYPDFSSASAPARSPLAPARRASILMFIMGGLAMFCGLIMSIGGALLTPENIAAMPNSADWEAIQSQSPLPIRVMFIVFAVMALVPGILYVVLGFFVRRGGMISCVLALILSGITGIVVLLQVVGLVTQRSNPLATVMAGCMIFCCLIVISLLAWWLVEAVRAAPAVAAMRQQFNAQYWQSFQHQQQYAQGGYGYGPAMAGGGYAPAPPPGPAALPQQTYQPSYPSAFAPPPGPSNSAQLQHPPLPPATPPQNPSDAENRDSANPG